MKDSMVYQHPPYYAYTTYEGTAYAEYGKEGNQP